MPSKESKVRWLHITDLHMGATRGWLWTNLEEALFEDLTIITKRLGGPPDLIFFTGDLVYSGNPGQFRKLDALLARLWRHVGGLGSAPVLLPVPGNHDLARPTGGETSS